VAAQKCNPCIKEKYPRRTSLSVLRQCSKEMETLKEKHLEIPELKNKVSEKKKLLNGFKRRLEIAGRWVSGHEHRLKEIINVKSI
jgi:hypothetical protein